MGLDDIKLSPFLVKKLFDKNLVISSFAQKAITVELSTKTTLTVPKIVDKKITTNIDNGINFLGKNAKNILILINEKDQAYLGDEDLAFLINILNACKINMADVAVVNCHAEGINSETLQQQFLPEKLLFFGTEPQLLGYPLQIPTYKIQHYNGQQFLCALPLKNIGVNKEEKKILWNVLKSLFEI